MIKKIKPYFEGWYLKHHSNGETISFIISFHTDVKGEKSVCVQMINNEGSYSKYYDHNQCICADDKFEVYIGNNKFCDNGIDVDIQFEKMHVKGSINYSRFTPLEYDIMGPFKYVPFMECRHGVISLAHDLTGELCIDDKIVNFDKGMGYIEKDQGTSFPKSYLWSQCNFKDITNNCIFIATANIPILNTSFNGLICEVLYQNKHYRLATYNNSRVIKQTSKYLEICNGHSRLVVDVFKQNAFELDAPKFGKMAGVIHESPCATIRYQFYVKNHLLFDITSEYASYEYFDKNDY